MCYVSVKLALIVPREGCGTVSGKGRVEGCSYIGLGGRVGILW